MKFSLINFCFLIVLIHSCYGFSNNTIFTGKIESFNKTTRLQYGDLLKCKVYDIERENNQTEGGLRLIQKGNSEPIYFPLSFNQTCFTFSVKTELEPIEINLADNYGIVRFKTVLGQFNKTTKSFESFLYDASGYRLVKIIHDDSVFNKTRFIKVWIELTKNGTDFEIGFDNHVLLGYNGSYKPLTQIGIVSNATVSNTEYIIHREPKCYTSSVKPAVQTARIFCERFTSDNSTNNVTENNLILIQKDLYHQIYSDSNTFNETIKGTGNSTSNLYAKRHLTELDELFTEAKYNHQKIMHSNDTKLIENYLHDYVYVQIKWQYFNYLKSVLENIKN